MEDVPESKDFSFPLSEEATLAWWESVDAFGEQLRRTEGGKPFVFYDGPPFATGLPHYGHLLAGTIKDVVTRFASATGHHVPRRFGWDCHGLPIEHEIDKKLKITSKADVEGVIEIVDGKKVKVGGMGIAAYNDACRAIVMTYSGEWRKTVLRAGRWIDFDADYKTLDTNFMESVWWVFSQLHAKGLVYRGFKVMPFSTNLKTPLSNFEAGQNYKDVSDPAVMVSFPLLDDDDDDGEEGESGENGAAATSPSPSVDARPSLVAWTTTPWTLPSNLALCVHPDVDYVTVRQRATGRVFIVAEARLSALPGAAASAAGKKKDGEGGGGEGGGGGGGGSKKKDKKKKGGEPAAAAAAAAAPAPDAAAAPAPDAAAAPAPDAAAAPAPEAPEEEETEAGKRKKGEEEGGYELLSTVKGSALAGRSYEPLFPFFASLRKKKGDDRGGDDKSGSSPPLKGAFRVLADTYVTADSGTGVVHCAPAFGEDDMRVCLAGGVIARDGGMQQGEEGEEEGSPSSASAALGSMPCPVDADGKFTAAVGPALRGRHVKDKGTDREILAAVKAAGRLVQAGTVVHSYPFCWRSETPLIYKAVPSWFVRVEQIKEQLLGANAQTRWVPQYVKEKRFHNWLESARDWAVSRSRFWGTPLPVWTSEDGAEVVVIGSVAELEERASLPKGSVSDLHRQFVDGIEIPSSTPGNPPLRRVEDVFDCWFESGSMPYAQAHYPFAFPGGERGDGAPGSEAARAFLSSRFPADFVAEGLDQTRGWFYTLMVLSTALFDGAPAFRNLVCNGLVLAADGKKMSKRLQNYPDPKEVLEAHGADALRLYLINSPVVRAEPLRFQEAGVREVVKVVFLPWYNAYRFLVQSARRWEADQMGGGGGGGEGKKAAWRPDPAAAAASRNVLDRWLLASSRELARFVSAEMGAYRLYTVVPRLTRFIADLTNVYVRYNRGRLKGKDAGGAAAGDDDDDDEGGAAAASAAASASAAVASLSLSASEEEERDRTAALSTLHAVLTELCVVMAPFTPFLCELMWRNLRRALLVGDGDEEQEEEEAKRAHEELFPASVHWARFPAPAEDREGDDEVRGGVEAMQRAIELTRTVRERGVRPLRQPLRSMVVVHPDPAVLALLTPDLKRYIVSQTNIRHLELSCDASKWCSAAAVPDWAALGKRLGKGVSAVRAALAAADADLLARIERGDESVTVAGFELAPGEVKVVRSFAPSAEALESMGGPGGGGASASTVDGAGDASGLFVALDLSLDADLLAEGAAREVASRVQKARKTAGLSAQDPAVAWLGGAASGGAKAGEGKGERALPSALAAALEGQAAWLRGALGGEWRALGELPAGAEELVREEHSLPAGKFELVLTRGE